MVKRIMRPPLRIEYRPPAAHPGKQVLDAAPSAGVHAGGGLGTPEEDARGLRQRRNFFRPGIAELILDLS